MKFQAPQKIFIIDDDPMFSHALLDMITRSVKHDVTIYHTGEEALSNMDQNPDFIVLDYYLNTVSKDAADGMEILQIVKSNFPSTKIILCSSQDKYGLAMQTIKLGALEYVVKDDLAFDKITKLISTH